MFSRWRNLAASAGAICLPFAFAQAAPRLDDLHCTRPATCARFHERTITDEQIEFDQDNWYRRYYGNTLNETTSNEVAEPQSEDPENYGANDSISNDDEYGGQYTPTFNEFDDPMNDFSDFQTPSPIGKTEVDGEGRCSDLTCPCHTVVDLDCDEEIVTDVPAADSQPSQRPIAILTGTIEPIFDEPIFSEFEEAAMNADIPEAGSTSTESTVPNIDEPASGEDTTESTVPNIDEPASGEDTTESTVSNIDEPASGEDTTESTVPNTDEPASGDETAGDDSFEACGDPEVSPPSDPTDYHMFYPGCDWSAYDPSVKNSDEEPETPSEPAEESEPAPTESTFVPGVETLLLLWF